MKQDPGSEVEPQASVHLGSTLESSPTLDRSVEARHIVPQRCPYLLVVDAVIRMVGDDPHALDLPSRRRRNPSSVNVSSTSSSAIRGLLPRKLVQAGSDPKPKARTAVQECPRQDSNLRRTV